MVLGASGGMYGEEAEEDSPGTVLLGSALAPATAVAPATFATSVGLSVGVLVRVLCELVRVSTCSSTTKWY